MYDVTVQAHGIAEKAVRDALHNPSVHLALARSVQPAGQVVVKRPSLSDPGERGGPVVRCDYIARLVDHA